MKRGTADFVTEVTYTRVVRRFGFTAYLIDRGDNGAIWLVAQRWKGRQPRLCLRRLDEGHADWLALLMDSPEINQTMRFVGSAEASRSEPDQWLTHGPSKLLA